MIANVSTSDFPEKKLSDLLSQIYQPARIQILLIIGSQETCVCHIETVTGMRQASISQHLMILRKAGLVSTCRKGRHIFYHLTKPEVIEVLQLAANLAGIKPDSFLALSIRPIKDCSCPQCNPNGDPKLTCKKVTQSNS